METVQPLPDRPMAIATLGSERALLVADYHAGLEAALRQEEGLEADSQAAARRELIQTVVRDTAPDRLIILGDFMHSIGGPGGAERGELEVLLEQLPSSLSISLVKGNHDGDIEQWLPEIEIIGPEGRRFGSLGVVHGHTWPAPDVLEASVVCIGHEHPQVRLTDAVGGTRVERVWLRGSINPTPFVDREYPAMTDPYPELIVFPAFNDLAGGTWVNVPDQEFLAPFLPQALSDGEAFLLDGTRLGPYRRI